MKNRPLVLDVNLNLSLKSIQVTLLKVEIFKVYDRRFLKVKAKRKNIPI